MSSFSDNHHIFQFSQFKKKYELSDKDLGSGTFGVVRLASRVADGMPVAVKALPKRKVFSCLELLLVMKSTQIKDIRDVLNEVLILKVWMFICKFSKIWVIFL